MIMYATATFACALAGLQPQGELPPSHEKVLLPVVVDAPIPGVNGSLWTTDVWIANPSEVAIEVDGVIWNCGLPECGNLPAVVDAGRTFQPRIAPAPAGFQGTFLDVVSGFADSLAFELRFRDLSRQAETWGTELPAVHERDFRGDSISLTDIPIETGFRQTIRIYESSGLEAEAQVRVRTYLISATNVEPNGPPDTLLGERILSLEFPPLESRPAHPGYFAISDLSQLGDISTAERVRVEIQPLSSNLKVWAFATIVHNETQHATVVTPQ